MTEPDGPEFEQLAAFVGALPKVELHVHLEGSISPSTLVALARSNPSGSLPIRLDQIEELYAFHDFVHFLDRWVLVCDQLRTGDHFATITRELGASLAAQNVRYAEVSVAPAGHVRRGVAPAALFEGLEEGRLDVEAAHGVRLRWCAEFGTRRGVQAAMETVQLLRAHRPAGFVSLGLAGLESSLSRAEFARPLALGRDMGLRTVVHAGETSGPSSIWEAIQILGAERIAHGIRCTEDPALVSHLRDRAIPLDVCPTSNVRTGVVRSIERHPLPMLLAEGLLITINSDDPAMFRTSVNQEYLLAALHVGMTAVDLTELAKTSARAAFLPAEEAERLLIEIDAAAGRALKS